MDRARDRPRLVGVETVDKEELMFTKQHYKAVAKIISQYSTTPHGDKPFLVKEFVKLFKPDNQLFNEVKFVEACGMSWEEYCG